MRGMNAANRSRHVDLMEDVIDQAVQQYTTVAGVDTEAARGNADVINTHQGDHPATINTSDVTSLSPLLSGSDNVTIGLSSPLDVLRADDNFMLYMLAGGVLLAFSMWWLINILGRYFHSLNKATGYRYESSATYACMCCPCGKNGTLEIEGIIKILGALAAVIFSVINNLANKTSGADVAETQAVNVKVITMVVFFGCEGLVDVIAHASTVIPRGVEYLGLSLAFLIQAILLNDINWSNADLLPMHEALVYIAYACSACCLVEMMYRHAVYLAVLRGAVVMLQGAWLMQISFHPTLTPDQSVALLMSWSIAAVFGCVVLLSLMMGGAYKCCGGEATNVDYYKYDSKDGAVTKLIKRDSNGHTIINFDDDSDESETEFDQGLLAHK